MTRPPATSIPSPTAGRQPLTRDRVLRAAVEIVDREGVEALSMRRLGAGLGVEAMSLYNHVPNKAAVLDGIVEVIVNEIEIASVAGDWKENVRLMARSYRAVALRHPKIVPLISLRPFNTLPTLRPVEYVFDVFCTAGFGPEAALHAFRTIAGFVTGYTLAETGDFFGEIAGEGQLTVADLPSEHFPRIQEVGPYLAGTNHDDEFEFALDVILSGLEDKLQSGGRG